MAVVVMNTTKHTKRPADPNNNNSSKNCLNRTPTTKQKENTYLVEGLIGGREAVDDQLRLGALLAEARPAGQIAQRLVDVLVGVDPDARPLLLAVQFAPRQEVDVAAVGLVDVAGQRGGLPRYALHRHLLLAVGV